MELQHITPEEAGISSKHILECLDAEKRNGTELHSFMFLRHGKVFAEGYYKPYNKNSRHSMFSFTKTLTSTAIGFARQEGYLSLDEKLVDIFPEKLPERVSDNLKKATVENLLTMSCGHDDEIPVFGLGDPDWQRAFFAHPFIHEPGTHFCYNTAGTNLLAAVLKKKAGKALTEFLKPRLFDKIGIGDVPCMTLMDGTMMGGAGSRLKTEEMAKFIQFVANRGVWEGERLLSDEWFELATTSHICDSDNATGDWAKGYGYQFWRCSPKGVFRADGAYGQFGVVAPLQDAVLIITSASGNLQNTLTPLWEYILPNLQDKSLPEDKEGNKQLDCVISHCELPAPISTRSMLGEDNYNHAVYKPDKKLTGNWADLVGGAGITSKGCYAGVNKPQSVEEFKDFTIEVKPFVMELTATVGDKKETLPVSLESRYNSFKMGERVFGSVGRWLRPNIFEFTVRSAESPTGKHFTLYFTEKGLTMRLESTYPDYDPLNDPKEDDITFKKILP